MTSTLPALLSPETLIARLDDPALLSSAVPGGPSATAALARLAQQAFGAEWPAALAHYTGVAPRTCQRIRAAAELGDEAPAARGVLTEYLRVAAGQAQAAFNALIGGAVQARWAVYDRDITMLGLSRRAASVARNEGWTRVGHVATAGSRALSRIPNCGSATVAEFEAALGHIGLTADEPRLGWGG